MFTEKNEVIFTDFIGSILYIIHILSELCTTIKRASQNLFSVWFLLGSYSLETQLSIMLNHTNIIYAFL